MYVNDEPLVFSKTFVSVIPALLRIVWWSVGFTVVFCVQPAGCPRSLWLHPHGRVGMKQSIHTLTHVGHAKGSIYFIMYVGSAATDSILQNETSRKVFFGFFPHRDIIVVLFIYRTSANGGEGRMIYESRIRPHTNPRSRRSWKMNHIYCIYI